MTNLLPFAEFIGTKENLNTFVLKKDFNLDKLPKEAKIYATALGVYFIKINGQRLGDAYLAPGWTSYNKMLQVQEYDCIDLLQVGHNTIEMFVNVGWYAGRLAWVNNYGIYGKKIAGALELYLDELCIYTDTSWDSYNTYITSSSIYDGEIIDFNNPLTKLTTDSIIYNKDNLVKQICEPVRNIMEKDVVEVITTPSGDIVYDFGQNLTGVVRVNVPNDYDEELTLKFAEILIDNEFYTENLRSAKCTDIINHAAGKTVDIEFTFHGFRYLHVDSKKFLPKECFKALVRHTDMNRTGEIHSSDVSFNKLMENITWGQRGNFLDIPTDCPQRDERLGWTGDINAFCKTACYNFDVRQILKKYLCDLRNDQSADGKIPHVAPDCLFNGSEPSALWSDVICFVPWTLYEMYGDESFLRDNIAAMKLYMHALEDRMEDGLLVKGQVYGDWLALDNEVVFKDDSIGRTNKLYLGNVFYLADCKIIADASKVLGNEKDYDLYMKKYQYTLEKVQEEYFNVKGKLMVDTVTAKVVALHFNIVKEENKLELARMLAEDVKKRKYHVTTGFIGTAYLLFALSDNGYFDVASKLIMNHEFPGWLYEVDMGATTTWERWSSLMPDGKPDSKGMNSYNHYAYGAMKEFIYRYVAGIETNGAGFKKVNISPRVVDGLNDITASYNSVNGLITSSYKVLEDKVIYDITIPENIEGTITIDGKVLGNGNGSFHFEVLKK